MDKEVAEPFIVLVRRSLTFVGVCFWLMVGCALIASPYLSMRWPIAIWALSFILIPLQCAYWHRNPRKL